MVNINIPNYIVWIIFGVIFILVAVSFIVKFFMGRKKKEIKFFDQDYLKSKQNINIQTYDDLNKETEVKESLKSLITRSDKRVKPEKELTVRKKRLEQKAIPETELNPEKFYYEVLPFEYFDRSKLSFRYWLDKRKAKKYPHKVVLVRFEMNNGRHREFIVKEDADGFVYNKEKYIFDIENKYYVIDSNIWVYDFHEGFSLPVRNKKIINPEILKIFDSAFEKLLRDDSRKGIERKINSDLLKETIDASGITQIECAVNPKILERVSESQFVQMILQGATLGKLFKVLLILMIIALIVVVADLVVDFISSGLIDEIGLGKKEE